MPQCIAYGCNNNTKDDATTQINFFRLPIKNKARMKVWMAKLKLQEPHITEHTRICSEHFTEDQFLPQIHLQGITTKHNSKRRLRDDAVPTIFCFSELSKLRSHSEKRAKKREQKEIAHKLATEIPSNESLDFPHTSTVYVESATQMDPSPWIEKFNLPSMQESYSQTCNGKGRTQEVPYKGNQ